MEVGIDLRWLWLSRVVLKLLHVMFCLLLDHFPQHKCVVGGLARYSLQQITHLQQV